MAEAWHADIQENDIGAKLLRFFDSVGTVYRAAPDCRTIGTNGQQQMDAMPQQRSRQDSLSDLKQDALVVGTSNGRRAENISVGIDGQAAVGKTSLAATGKVVEIGVGPVALARR